MSEENPVVENTEDKPALAEMADQQPHESGGDEAVSKVARAMGWRPKGEFTGPEDTWEDAASYLENQPKKMKELRAAVARTHKTTARIIADNQRKAKAEAEERIRQAVELNDPEAAIAAAREIQDDGGNDKDVATAWADERPWFHSDELAKAVAIAAADKAMKAGKPIDEQLEEAEKAVKKRFPEYFEADKASTKAVKQNAPVVAGGARAATGAPRGKGWIDLPVVIRNDPHVKKMIVKGMVTEAEYASAYFEENA